MTATRSDTQSAGTPPLRGLLPTGLLPVCLLFVACALLAGCATGNSMYCMDNYSTTLYASRKNPAPEVQQKHVKAMEDIVAKSEQRNLRVPPGIFAELGYIQLKAGNMPEAKKYFDAENRLYPESKVFTERLLAWANPKTGDAAGGAAGDAATPPNKGDKGGTGDKDGNVITPADALTTAPTVPAGEGATHE